MVSFSGSSRFCLQTTSSSSSSAVNRRARQNKTPRRSRRKNRQETVVQGSSNVGQKYVQPLFPSRMIFDNQVYNIIQTVQKGNITSSTTLSTFTALNFQLNDLDQAASLSAIFDQYKIKMIEVEFIPGQNSQTSATGTTGLFATVVDYDDAAAVATMGALFDYTNCISDAGFNKQRRTFHPHAALAAYSGAFSSYANIESPWIDMNSLTVQHYGIKTGWTATPSVSIITVVVRYWIQCRNIR
jgi:hypothetical protein